ncbi:hypothetical protein [Paraburkholderia bryophila]|uniref:hypothetical protein n=1 Tax=Paraburkholderia bryophila TaxID=420952 RepID=UPI00359C30F2
MHTMPTLRNGDAARTLAKFENGVLTVTVPKLVSAQSRSRNIDSASGTVARQGRTQLPGRERADGPLAQSAWQRTQRGDRSPRRISEHLSWVEEKVAAPPIGLSLVRFGPSPVSS